MVYKNLLLYFVLYVTFFANFLTDVSSRGFAEPSIVIIIQTYFVKWIQPKENKFDYPNLAQWVEFILKIEIGLFPLSCVLDFKPTNNVARVLR